MTDYIYISREGHTFNVRRELTEEEKKTSWGRKKTITETLKEAPARIISPRLAVYKEENATAYRSAMWHVIHIPTGLVIACCETDIIKDVKATFENSKWTFGKDKNTLKLFEDAFSFEMHCEIRYTIRKEPKQ